MALISSINRKPFDYVKWHEIFGLLPKTPIEEGGSLMQSQEPIAFNEIWINPGDPEIGESLTVRLVTPGVEVPADKDGQCMNLPQYLIPSVKTILGDRTIMDQIHRGKAGVVLFEYENKWGTQVGARFVDL